MYELRIIRERRAGYPTPRSPIRNSAELVESFRRHFDGLDREQFIVVLLNQKNKPLGWHVVSTGTLTMSLVHPRETFKAAIVASAAAIVAMHNHPSGDPTPSIEDRQITARLVAAGQLLGIPVLDHIVIGDPGYYSFRDNDCLDSDYRPIEIAAEAVHEERTAAARRVAIYVRVSSGDQTVENQLRALREHAARARWEIVATTPTTPSAAPASAGPASTRSWPTRAVASSISSRLLRSIGSAATSATSSRSSTSYSTSASGSCRSVRRSISRSPIGRAMFALVGVLAEVERAWIIERTNAGLARARSQGKRLGRPPAIADLPRLRRLLNGGASYRSAARLLEVSEGAVRLAVRRDPTLRSRSSTPTDRQDEPVKATA